MKNFRKIIMNNGQMSKVIMINKVIKLKIINKKIHNIKINKFKTILNRHC